MAGEQAIDEADLIGNEQAEAQAQHTGSCHQSTSHPGKPRTRIGERQRERGRNQDHSTDRADSEDQKIKDAPARVVNRVRTRSATAAEPARPCTIPISRGRNE